MSVRIDPLAAVHPLAVLDEGVEVGPFCVVSEHARIGRGTRLEAHVTIMGHVTMGRDNRVFPNAVIGGDPQDLGYCGEPTEVVIGDNNTFREGVTVNRATTKEQGVTRIGSHNFFMALAHVAHDCQVGDHIIVGNNVLLGGHVHIQERAILSGGTAVHHFGTVGRFAFVGGLSVVRQDIPPFMLCDGTPATPRTVNKIALCRNGFPEEMVTSLCQAHRLIFRKRVGLTGARAELLRQGLLNEPVLELLDFLAFQRTGRHGRGRDGANRFQKVDYPVAEWRRAA